MKWYYFPTLSFNAVSWIVQSRRSLQIQPLTARMAAELRLGSELGLYCAAMHSRCVYTAHQARHSSPVHGRLTARSCCSRCAQPGTATTQQGERHVLGCLDSCGQQSKLHFTKEALTGLKPLEGAESGGLALPIHALCCSSCCGDLKDLRSREGCREQQETLTDQVVESGEQQTRRPAEPRPRQRRPAAIGPGAACLHSSASAHTLTASCC